MRFLRAPRTAINVALSVGSCLLVQYVAARLGAPDAVGGLGGIVAAFLALRLLSARVRALLLRSRIGKYPPGTRPAHGYASRRDGPRRRRSRPLLWVTFLMMGAGLALADRASPIFWPVIVLGGISFAVNAAELLLDR
ncbi:MAG: hypothetical protein DI523_36345 [Paraburkholderia fungorum]|nr:MAG: hypothetical protein DI523_36345 [Paraburkholderia fungorum]